MTEQASGMLDDAVSYVAQDSRPAAERLLIRALEAASSLDVSSERGRVVPELARPNVRQLLVDRYRLIYEVTPDEMADPSRRVKTEPVDLQGGVAGWLLYTDDLLPTTWSRGGWRGSGRRR